MDSLWTGKLSKDGGDLLDKRLAPRIGGTVYGRMGGLGAEVEGGVRSRALSRVGRVGFPG